MKLIAVKHMVLAVGLLLAVVQNSQAFAPFYSWKDKCAGADVIVRGVVVDVVQLVGKVKDSRGSELETITDGGYTGPSAVAIFRVTAVVKEGDYLTESVIFIPCGYNHDENPAELTKTKEYFLFLRSMGSNYFDPLNNVAMHRVQKGRVDLEGGDGDNAFGSEAGKDKTTDDEDFVKRIREALREVGQYLPEGFTAKNYTVTDNYVQLLYEKAFEKTGDKQFSPPAGDNVTWDPTPGIALKALGLELRKGYSMALTPGGFVYSADAAGHEEFLKLNRTIGIEIDEGR
ncbi:hypothetical protein OVA24_09775 [Luteolibacter sp. SL250]|uniref:hypothetical protein n=1 Tax=Luteolibacter sp. SL250 TaxID=2995170 RepID=UPI00226EC52F|nr:hypothetical protein [Luteolibacter sp. SL250]WAC21673.1 hypothetical protein OVA24_09775 [Luteolibacter sp. SL250]